MMKKILLILSIQFLTYNIFAQNQLRLTGPKAKNYKPFRNHTINESAPNINDQNNIQITKHKKWLKGPKGRKWLAGTAINHKKRWSYVSKKKVQHRTVSFPRVKVRK